MFLRPLFKSLVNFLVVLFLSSAWWKNLGAEIFIETIIGYAKYLATFLWVIH